jgi:Raf kinase inhibitor-like YbhB/YbcL family protein
MSCFYYVLLLLLNINTMNTTTEMIDTLMITSPAFQNGADIPAKYTCQGENINPELDISGIPKEAKTLALIMEDSDAPSGTFDHWLVWNINPTEQIAENSLPGIPGRNSFGHVKYGGPCPPSGSHRYYFKIYALDKSLHIGEGENKQTLTREMKGHIIARGELMGRYQKS